VSQRALHPNGWHGIVLAPSGGITTVARRQDDAPTQSPLNVSLRSKLSGGSA